jgi:hypothetical protein
MVEMILDEEILTVAIIEEIIVEEEEIIETVIENQIKMDIKTVIDEKHLFLGKNKKYNLNIKILIFKFN